MPGWEKVIDKYGINYFVLKSMDSSGMILPIVPALANHPGWSLVFADGLFVVFVRNSPELQGYIKAHEIPKGILPRHIIQEAYHYTFLGISPAAAYQIMSNMYMLMGDRQAAIEALKKALAEVDDPYLRARLAQLQETSPFQMQPRR
jgi:tetratricopeptide (TPR) repeat protein